MAGSLGWRSIAPCCRWSLAGVRAPQYAKVKCIECFPLRADKIEEPGPEIDFCENLAPKFCTPPLFPRLLSAISRKFRAAPETAKLHPRKSVSLRNLRKFRGARAPNTAKLHPRKSVYLTSRRKFQNIHRCTETSPTRLCGPTNIPNHPRSPGNVGQCPTFPGRCRIPDASPNE